MRWVQRGVMVLLFLTIIVAGFGNAVLHLWNALMPEIFGLRPITFWQALGLISLSWILFGGLGMFRGRPLWASRRFAHLPPEERERLMEGLRRGRCGGRE